MAFFTAQPYLSLARIVLSSTASASPGSSRSSCFFTVSNMFTSIMSKTRGFPYLWGGGEEGTPGKEGRSWWLSLETSLAAPSQPPATVPQGNRSLIARLHP